MGKTKKEFLSLVFSCNPEEHFDLMLTLRRIELGLSLYFGNTDWLGLKDLRDHFTS